MSKTPQDTDPAAWHKYFAIECNNRAWDLASQARTAAEDQELRLTAHTAAHHWNAVGEELHRMRATMLLAEAALEAIADAEDKAIVLATFELVPVPAGGPETGSG